VYRRLGGTKGALYEKGIIFVSMEKEMKIIIWEQVLFAHQRIVSTVKRIQFVSDRKSCIVLRGCWCHITVLRAHLPNEKTSDDSNDSFDEELEEVFDHFPKYNMKIM